MFTGIVEELGRVVAVTGGAAGDGAGDGAGGAGIRVRGPLVVTDTRPGDSVAVNGVCLTVVEVTGDTFTADVMRETLRCSSLAALRAGDPVNLERAATLGTRLGGHLMQGHVDGVGRILAREPGPHWDEVRFSLPEDLSRYVVEKGSITVDGVSLTVTAVADDWFGVGLIPTTLRLTVLGHKAVGDPVNLEVDVVAKYVERLLGAGIGAYVTGVRA